VEVAVRLGLAAHLELALVSVQQHLVRALAQVPALQRPGVVLAFRGSGVGAAWTGRHLAGGPAAGLPAVPAPEPFQALVIPAEQVQPLAQGLALQRQAHVLADASAQAPVRQPEVQPQVQVPVQRQAVQVLAPVVAVVPQQLVAVVLAPAQVLPQAVRVPVPVVARHSARQVLHQALPARRLRPPVRQKCRHRLPGHQPVPAALPATAGAHFQR
jgi:hypothetical protein